MVFSDMEYMALQGILKRTKYVLNLFQYFKKKIIVKQLIQ